MITALIFDFDGLIIDTETPVLQSWQELYTEYNVELPLEEWLTCIGADYTEDTFQPYTYLERALGHSLDWETITPRRYRRELELAHAQPLLPGVMDYISGARQRGLKLGVASSSSCEWVVGHLERLGLAPYFDAVRCADHVTALKPDPALYIEALAALGVPAAEAIALEDSANGVLAARRAGLFCVAVPNALTRHMDFSQADLRVESLAALPLDDLLAWFADGAR